MIADGRVAAVRQLREQRQRDEQPAERHRSGRRAGRRRERRQRRLDIPRHDHDVAKDDRTGAGTVRHALVPRSAPSRRQHGDDRVVQGGEVNVLVGHRDAPQHVRRDSPVIPTRPDDERSE